MPWVPLPSVWKNLFQAGPGSHILGVARMPTSVSIWQIASNSGGSATDELWTVMSTPFGKPAWASSSLAFFWSKG